MEKTEYDTRINLVNTKQTSRIPESACNIKFQCPSIPIPQPLPTLEFQLPDRHLGSKMLRLLSHVSEVEGVVGRLREVGYGIKFIRRRKMYRDKAYIFKYFMLSFVKLMRYWILAAQFALMLQSECLHMRLDTAHSGHSSSKSTWPKMWKYYNLGRVYFLIRDDFLAFVPSCTLSVLTFLDPFDCSPSLSFGSGRFGSELFGGGEIESRGLDADFPSSVPESPIISLAKRARSISAAGNSTHHCHPIVLLPSPRVFPSS